MGVGVGWGGGSKKKGAHNMIYKSQSCIIVQEEKLLLSSRHCYFSIDIISAEVLRNKCTIYMYLHGEARHSC